MRFSCFLVALVAAGLIYGAESGDTLYVSERLYLSLTNEPNANATRIRLLQSAEPLQMLTQEGDFIQVSTSDGLTGWVRAAYVSTAEPSTLRLERAEQENDSLTRRIAELNNEIQNLQTEIRQLQTAESIVENQAPQENDAVVNKSNQLQSRITELENILKEQQNRRPDDATTLQNPTRFEFLVLSSVVILILGFFLGHIWRSRQVRRRLYGMDI
ncbi:MAG: TIGR04211 family SH3 domain-containing protein [Gammaproteobacteria bacterium]|nr:TIGR04211 family SH3 domain-containing protein [Gammaproteobacteria bacterium]